MGVRLTVRDLAVGHGGRALQRGLQFDLEPGQCLAVQGPSGCGKTTLLRSLAGLEPPLAGELRLGSATPAELGWPTWRRRVVYAAQRATFFGGTVAEELARPFRFATSRRPFRPDAGRDALRGLGVRDKWETPAAELSEGERQRVALVRAALLEPAVMLLDEPTSALDPATVESVEAWLSQLDVAIVMVTHDGQQATRFASQHLMLEEPADA